MPDVDATYNKVVAPPIKNIHVLIPFELVSSTTRNYASEIATGQNLLPLWPYGYDLAIWTAGIFGVSTNSTGARNTFYLRIYTKVPQVICSLGAAACCDDSCASRMPWWSRGPTVVSWSLMVEDTPHLCHNHRSLVGYPQPSNARRHLHVNARCQDRNDSDFANGRFDVAICQNSTFCFW